MIRKYSRGSYLPRRCDSASTRDKHSDSRRQSGGSSSRTVVVNFGASVRLNILILYRP